MKFLKLFYNNLPSIRLVHHQVGARAELVRTISASDVTQFTRLSGDSNPVHSIDSSERALVHGALLNSLVSGLLGTQLPGSGAIVIEQRLRFPNKCFAGDTVSVRAELVENRKIMLVRFECVVIGDGKCVLEGDARLVWSK